MLPFYVIPFLDVEFVECLPTNFCLAGFSKFSVFLLGCMTSSASSHPSLPQLLLISLLPPTTWLSPNHFFLEFVSNVTFPIFKWLFLTVFASANVSESSLTFATYSAIMIPEVNSHAFVLIKENVTTVSIWITHLIRCIDKTWRPIYEDSLWATYKS